MKHSDCKLVAAIDIGAGRGAKIGIARVNGRENRWIAESMLSRRFYGTTVEQLTQALALKLKSLMSSQDLEIQDLAGVGVDTPGLIDGSQRIIECENLPFLSGTDLRTSLQNELQIPVFMSNDGKSGAVGEWSVRQHELIYWVFGGGWGGAWIDALGNVKFNSGIPADITTGPYCTNEPGYSIEISFQKLHPIFEEFGASLESFRQNYTRELESQSDFRKQHLKETDSIRAEVAVSGVGCWRLFHSFQNSKEDNRVTDSLKAYLKYPDAAGPAIHRLAMAGYEKARKTYMLFGRLLGEVATIVLLLAQKDGAPVDIPVYLGGKVGNSYDLFAPEARKTISQYGIQSQIHSSYFLNTTLNANLVGVLHQTLKHFAGNSHYSAVC